MVRVPASLLATGAAVAIVAAATPAYATSPPTPVTGLAATAGDMQVRLTWTNPADADFAGVTVVEAVGTTPPATTADGTTVYDGTAATTTVTGLVNGTTYAFSVFTRNTGAEKSGPVSVTATPVPAALTTLTIGLTATTVTYGNALTVSGTLRRTDTGDPIANETIDVYRKRSGESSFLHVLRTTTNSAGVIRFNTAPPVNTQWYLTHPADPYAAPSTSPTVTTNVRVRITYSLSATTVEQNVAVTLGAAVASNHAGRVLVLQQYTDAWHSVSWPVLDSTSHIHLRLVTAVVGTRRFRLLLSPDADHAGAATTTISITVVLRTLRSGMSGNDVKAAQQRLRALHYDVPKVDGYFGFDTVHATAAFQKVNGLPVNGTVDAATRRRLADPVLPHLRYPRSDTWIEADLTKQVLYFARAGAVVRILDISSGSGKLFTVDGVTQRAVTPTGSFHIFHKIDGLRTSRLGELWRPAYFASGGYAIHGNGSVPFYPASHGCIRITVPAMNRLFALLTIGMRVYVYRS